ncbi:hypothetical protein [Geodermatophilus sp. FMUSA9-8]|uniref:hypothetical protein n=1 Tax=Geodermatophilus sp. FMUSA9-8 TaxID=3120155 RepID=UPI003009033A
MIPDWNHALNRDRYLDLRDTYTALVGADERWRSGEHDWLQPHVLHLSRYIVIRSAGFLESTRDTAASQFVASVAPAEVVRRVDDALGRGQGAAPKQLSDFLRTFSPSWATLLDEAFDARDGELRSRVGALIAARKKVAHGEGDPVTLTRALEGCEAAVTVADWIVSHFTALQMATTAPSAT